MLYKKFQREHVKNSSSINNAETEQRGFMKKPTPNTGASTITSQTAMELWGIVRDAREKLKGNI